MRTRYIGTDLGLGLLEAAAIIGIVVDVATLIKYLVEVGRHLRDGEKQRLEGKDCRGTTLIDIGRLQAVLNGVKTLRTVNELPGECFPCP